MDKGEVLEPIQGTNDDFARFLIGNARICVNGSYYISVPIACMITYLAERIAKELRESPDETLEIVFTSRSERAKEVLGKLIQKPVEFLDGLDGIPGYIEIMRDVSAAMPRSTLDAIDKNHHIWLDAMRNISMEKIKSEFDAFKANLCNDTACKPSKFPTLCPIICSEFMGTRELMILINTLMICYILAGQGISRLIEDRCALQ